MHPSPRPELRDLAPVPHGGDAPPGLLDFSTGVSPLAPPPAVLAALHAADVTRYPHPTALPLRERVARAHGLTPEEVAAGAGSTELIWAAARAFGGVGRSVVVLGPAFGEYAQAARASGAEVTELCCLLPPWAPEEILAAARRASPSLVFVCRPSSPCLSALDGAVVAELASCLPGALVVVDEAYLPLFDGLSPVAPAGNVALLRSLTKVFALPGLRVGYLLAAAPIAEAVRRALPPWNVSAPASAAAIAALGEGDALAAGRAEVARLREALLARLSAAGARIEASGGPFVLCRVRSARPFAQALFARGVRVRDCTSFGLPGHVRVGVRPEPEQAILGRAWEQSMEAA